MNWHISVIDFGTTYRNLKALYELVELFTVQEVVAQHVLDCPKKLFNIHLRFYQIKWSVSLDTSTIFLLGVNWFTILIYS